MSGWQQQQHYSYISAVFFCVAVFLCKLFLFFVSLSLSLWERFGPLPNLFSNFLFFPSIPLLKKRKCEETKRATFLRANGQGNKQIERKCWTNWQTRDTHKKSNKCSVCCNVQLRKEKKKTSGERERERGKLFYSDFDGHNNDDEEKRRAIEETRVDG